jgi:hypothetical protein
VPGVKKVFCIGFNKTGTSSLHALFMNCGMKSVHAIDWPLFSRFARGRDFFQMAQCYSDGEKSDFVQLDNWYPQSVFILNTRNERDWLRSRVKHVMRFNEPILLDELLRAPKYGEMAREFFFDEANAVLKWIIERRIYHKQARTYFKENPRFLDIDVTKAENWDTQVHSLLHHAGIEVSPNDPDGHRHRNKREGDYITDQDRLKAYFSLIDKALEERGADA